MPESPDIFRSCVDAADTAGLPFLLIGGHAVNARGYERTTLDIDLLIPAVNLDSWKQLMARLSYQPFHITKAFAQFEPVSGVGFRIDLMLVDSATFAKIHSGGERVVYAQREIHLISVLHLIALKLHATRTWDRAVQGTDYYDILNLIRLNNIDTHSPDFYSILNRHATPIIRERLLRDLARPL